MTLRSTIPAAIEYLRDLIETTVDAGVTVRSASVGGDIPSELVTLKSVSDGDTQWTFMGKYVGAHVIDESYTINGWIEISRPGTDRSGAALDARERAFEIWADIALAILSDITFGGLLKDALPAIVQHEDELNLKGDRFAQLQFAVRCRSRVKHQ